MLVIIFVTLVKRIVTLRSLYSILHVDEHDGMDRASKTRTQS